MEVTPIAIPWIKPKKSAARRHSLFRFSGFIVKAPPVTEEAKKIIAALQLAPLPGEGGFFRQTWRSAEPNAHDPARAAGSAIYFLLTRDAFSAFHRLRTDEIWHFHAGDPVEHVQLLSDDASPLVTRLGSHLLAGDTPQLVVPAGRWQGARLASALSHGLDEEVPGGWALLSCTLAPAWDEREFELGQRDALASEFRQAGEWIRALTR